jgi:hypothetical protein
MRYDEIPPNEWKHIKGSRMGTSGNEERRATDTGADKKPN